MLGVNRFSENDFHKIRDKVAFGPNADERFRAELQAIQMSKLCLSNLTKAFVLDHSFPTGVIIYPFK